HHKIKWNEHADVLAKSGARSCHATDLHLGENYRYNFSVYLNNNLVEISTRKLTKLVAGMRIGAEWYTSRAIRSYEDTNNPTHREIAFHIKCINDNLPVLTVLKERKPNLYKDDRCLACGNEKETTRHLVECGSYKSLWNNIEESGSTLAWKRLGTAKCKNLCKENVKKAIIGSSLEERYSRREDYLRGLVPEKAFLDLQNLCKMVVKWKQESGITFKSKREKGGKERVTEEDRAEEFLKQLYVSLVVNVEKDEERKKRKEEVQKLFNEGVRE
ncbi:29893_t:CDS:2, partial [Gigaspora margarita]